MVSNHLFEFTRSLFGNYFPVITFTAHSKSHLQRGYGAYEEGKTVANVSSPCRSICAT